MNINKLPTYIQSLLCALGVSLYVFLLGLFVTSGIIKDAVTPPLVGMLIFLLIFVVSASVTGTLVLGKPIMLFLANKKKEAVVFLASVIAWLLAIITILVIGFVLR